jgi:hypothetical protein
MDKHLALAVVPSSSRLDYVANRFTDSTRSSSSRLDYLVLLAAA